MPLPIVHLLPIFLDRSGCLLFLGVAPLEPFHTAGRIQHTALTGEEGMALAAGIDLDDSLGRTNSKSITTSTDYFGIGMIFGVNLFFHLSFS